MELYCALGGIGLEVWRNASQTKTGHGRCTQSSEDEALSPGGGRRTPTTEPISKYSGFGVLLLLTAKVSIKIERELSTSLYLQRERWGACRRFIHTRCQGFSGLVMPK